LKPNDPVCESVPLPLYPEPEALPPQQPSTESESVISKLESVTSTLHNIFGKTREDDSRLIGHTSNNIKLPSIKNNYIKVHDDKWKCVQCDKIMTHKYKKTHFEKSCRKGLDILQCEFCQVMCTNKDTKWRHKKTCQLNPANKTRKIYDIHT